MKGLRTRTLRGTVYQNDFSLAVAVEKHNNLAKDDVCEHVISSLEVLAAAHHPVKGFFVRNKGEARDVLSGFRTESGVKSLEDVVQPENILNYFSGLYNCHSKPTKLIDTKDKNALPSYGRKLYAHNQSSEWFHQTNDFG